MGVCNAGRSTMLAFKPLCFILGAQRAEGDMRAIIPDIRQMIETNAEMHLRDPKAIYRGWSV
jgi:hypothetical protein